MANNKIKFLKLEVNWLGRTLSSVPMLDEEQPARPELAMFRGLWGDYSGVSPQQHLPLTAQSTKHYGHPSSKTLRGQSTNRHGITGLIFTVFAAYRFTRTTTGNGVKGHFRIRELEGSPLLHTSHLGTREQSTSTGQYLDHTNTATH